MRGAKCFACRAQEIAFQRFFGRERKRMQHQVEPIGLATHLFKKAPDLSVTRDVAGKEWCFFSKFIDEFLDVLLYPFTLIIKNQSRPRCRPGFCDRPGDTALVRHSKNDTYFSCQNLLGHKSKRYAALTSRKKLKLRLEVVVDGASLGRISERKYSST